MAKNPYAYTHENLDEEVIGGCFMHENHVVDVTMRINIGDNSLKSSQALSIHLDLNSLVQCPGKVY